MKGIITLCGSTRFKEQFADAQFWLTMQGWAVFSLGTYMHSDKDPAIRDIVTPRLPMLDKLHRFKISRSNAILVIDVDGYIGEATASEIDFARQERVFIYSYNYSKKVDLQLGKLELLEPLMCLQCKKKSAISTALDGDFCSKKCQDDYFVDMEITNSDDGYK